ncbi:MAG: sigma 54-interacting transcriptional regulator [Deferribacterota bacterium]|nr:sigma 54-interacting transcriptional regulator [Deferribacterota bacterium]
MFNIKSYFLNNIYSLKIVRIDNNFPDKCDKLNLNNINVNILKNINKLEVEFLPIIDKDSILIGLLKTKDIKISLENNHATVNIIKDNVNILNIDNLTSIDELKIFIEEKNIKNNHIYLVNSKKRLIGYIPLYFINLLKNNIYFYYLTYTFNHINEAMIIIDKNSYVLWVNDIYCNLLGVPKYKIMGKFLKDIEPNAIIINVLKNDKTVNNYPIYIKSLKKKVIANIFPVKLNNEIIGAISLFSRDKNDNFNEHLYYNLKSNKHLIGENRCFKEEVALAKKVACTDAPVLINGETGTGKELVAYFIHENSIRKKGPFISINCAAIPKELFESEVFGYEQGAFTGAKNSGHKGKLYQANGGTLFLDEISELDISMQSKLLRVTQNMEYSPLGSNKTINVNVRLVSATNRNLNTLIDSGKFRKDLYYRLNVFEVNLPPLRERDDDILLLSNYYLSIFNKKYSLKLTFESSVNEILRRYSWPGNVRELENSIYHAVIISDGITIKPKDLPKHIYENTNIKNLPDKLSSIEKKEIIKAITNSNTITEAIEKLGISRRTFYLKTKKFNINTRDTTLNPSQF